MALDTGLYVPSTTSNIIQVNALLYATLTLTKVRSNDIDLDRLRTDQANSSLLIPVHSA